MNNYKIEFSSVANNDLNNIYDYIKEKLSDFENAVKVYEKIKDGISTLEYFPKRHPKVEVNESICRELRMLVIDSYIVIYLIDEELKRVNVKRILYASSNWKR